MMLIPKDLHSCSINPLSCPVKRDDFRGTPSPLGEGREGGNNNLSNYCLFRNSGDSYSIITNLTF
jgi:hypothetical protein